MSACKVPLTFSSLFISYVTMIIVQFGGLLSVRNRRVSIVQSNPLWGPRRNLVVPAGMAATVFVTVVNLYGPGLQDVFGTAPIPGMFWGIPFAFALGILVMDELRKLLVRTHPEVSHTSIRAQLLPVIDESVVDHCEVGVVRGYYTGGLLHRLEKRSVCCSNRTYRLYRHSIMHSQSIRMES